MQKLVLVVSSARLLEEHEREADCQRSGVLTVE